MFFILKIDIIRGTNINKIDTLMFKKLLVGNNEVIK